MSSTGTARFFPGPYPSRATITIENGDVIPNDKVVHVNPGAIIKFSNNDPDSYTLTFFVTGEDRKNLFAMHSDINLFLPGYGSTTMVADRYVLLATCEYDVEKTPINTVGLGVTQEMLDDLCVRVEESESQNPPRLAIRRSTGRAAGGGGGTVIIGN
jgi:hypothetical protein